MSESVKKRGGRRPGAGRPHGTGIYGEKTKPLRIPLSLMDDVAKFVASKGYRLPLYTTHVPAGYPDMPDDSVDEYVQLNELLVSNPDSTWLVTVKGDSMIKAGIFKGDILVVDSSLEAKHGQIVLASLNGEVTVKRLYSKGGVLQLIPENDAYPPIPVPKEADFLVCGVVCKAIRSF
ncbi:MAG: LexA family protein [Holosporales bacterium]